MFMQTLKVKVQHFFTILIMINLLFFAILVPALGQCPAFTCSGAGEADLYINWGIGDCFNAPPSEIIIEYENTNGQLLSHTHTVGAGNIFSTYILVFPNSPVCLSTSTLASIKSVNIPEFGNLICNYENQQVTQSGGPPLECPSEIDCLAHAGWVVLKYNETPCNLPQEAAFYFDDQLCANGTYSYVEATTQEGFFYMAYEIPCSVDPVNATVVFFPGTGQEKICVFSNGQLCSTCPSNITEETACEQLIENCGDNLVSFTTAMLGNQCTQWEGNCSSEDFLYRMGAVGIGFQQAPPWHLADYSLLVKGDIRTEQFKVCKEEGTGWCDYVFEKDYHLPDLYQVEAYIGQHRHLPDMSSEAELIASGGIELGEITLQQQEKIEEIFLYLIDIDKDLKKTTQLLRQP